MKNLIFSLCIFFSLSPLFSQEHENNPEEANTEIHEQHEEHLHKHAVSFFMSHTHISTGLENGQTKRLILASLGFNYNYNITEKWAIGLHNDLIIEDFEVEDPNAEGHNPESLSKFYEEESIAKIERSKPLSSAIMVSYKPIEHLVLMAGGGMEFSKNDNFGLIRLGLEIPFHIPNNWEVLGAVAYDFNIDAYNSFTLGIGIAKLF